MVASAIDTPIMLFKLDCRLTLLEASKHDILKNIDEVTKTTVDGSQWSDDLWINNDNLVNTVQSLVTQSLKKRDK